MEVWLVDQITLRPPPRSANWINRESFIPRTIAADDYQDSTLICTIPRN